MLDEYRRQYLIKYRDTLDRREQLIRLFTVMPSWPTIELSLEVYPDTLEVPVALLHSFGLDEIVDGKLVRLVKDINTSVDIQIMYYMGTVVEDKITLHKLGEVPKGTKAIDPLEEMQLNGGDIPNYSGHNLSSMVTTVGIYLLNQLILVKAFDHIVPYINGTLSCDVFNKEVTKALVAKTITPDQYHNYTTNLYNIGHFSELGSVNFTHKAYKTSPEVLALKAKLLEEYKDRLDEPEVMMHIENTLIKAHKEWLGDDLVTVFYDAVGSKAYDIHIKKMYLTAGVIPAFDETGTSFNSVPNSLDDGWDLTKFDVYANEIANASYKRGTETAKGGEQTKFSGRVYRDAKITEEDCGSTKGYLHRITPANYTRLVGRYYVEKQNGAYVHLTEEMLKQKIGQTLLLRDPLYCQTGGNGYCYICSGKTYKDLNNTAVGIDILEITSGILLDSMKNMHGVKLEQIEVDLFEYFV
jgi:hypothetical protein